MKKIADIVYEEEAPGDKYKHSNHVKDSVNRMANPYFGFYGEFDDYGDDLPDTSEVSSVPAIPNSNNIVPFRQETSSFTPNKSDVKSYKPADIVWAYSCIFHRWFHAVVQNSADTNRMVKVYSGDYSDVATETNRGANDGVFLAHLVQTDKPVDIYENIK